MGDLGIVASLDPVAADQACIDLVLQSPDEGKKQLLQRINDLHGYRTIKRCEEHGLGSRRYVLEVVE